MNQTQRSTLYRYYRAYTWANGDKKARELKLSYKRGWYTINGEKVQRGELERMIKTLWSRPQNADKNP